MKNIVEKGSNMYGWIDFTWNPIRGKCPHECVYCYMKRFPQKELSLDEKSFNDDLGENNTIFVGSSTDMFAETVLPQWISKVLRHCRKYPKNIYLFQSKNPNRFYHFLPLFPDKIILGTTLETDDETEENSFEYDEISKAPSISSRYEAMYNLPDYVEKMISIEPIINFDLSIFVDRIKQIKPKFVSIGADSKGSNLIEPSPEKVNQLIIELKKFTEVRIKPNLKRLLKC